MQFRGEEKQTIFFNCGLSECPFKGGKEITIVGNNVETNVNISTSQFTFVIDLAKKYFLVSNQNLPSQAE
jgi:hypothetical protein